MKFQFLVARPLTLSTLDAIRRLAEVTDLVHLPTTYRLILEALIDESMPFATSGCYFYTLICSPDYAPHAIRRVAEVTDLVQSSTP